MLQPKAISHAPFKPNSIEGLFSRTVTAVKNVYMMISQNARAGDPEDSRHSELADDDD